MFDGYSNPLGYSTWDEAQRTRQCRWTTRFFNRCGCFVGVESAAQFAHVGADNAEILHTCQQVVLSDFSFPAWHSEPMTEDDYKHSVGRRLKIAVEAVMAKEGITQAEVARKMRISPSRLGNYFRGEHYPNPYHVWLFCQRYGVTADWIYGELIPGLRDDLRDLILDGGIESPSARGAPRRLARRKRTNSPE
jgi:transcriptional regulator with XRE-family HTH domain